MRFLYVVDHPSRDLPAYAWWTIQSQFHSPSDDVALVSMSDVSRDVIAKNHFDVIFWNYARPNNISIIRDASRLGIYNIIHDTEGIPYDLSSFYSSLRSSDFKYINEIWTWGALQLQQLKCRFNSDGISTKVVNTGSIRYSYVKQLPKVNLSANKMALWNTNFPLISPRFNSFEHEFSDLHRKHNYSLAGALDMVRLASECRIYAAYKCISIASDLPHLNIMLRTHPFESRDFYMSFLKDVSLIYSSDHDVNLDISAAAFVLHSGCQTSLDAFLRGVPSFVFSHANANIWTSISCVLPRELHNLVDPDFLHASLRRQQQLISDFNLNQYLANLIDDYDYLHHFSLESIALPSNKLIPLWKAYYFLRRVISSLRCLLFSLIKDGSTVITVAPANKLSAFDIVMYIKNTYNVPVSILHKCVHITFPAGCSRSTFH